MLQTALISLPTPWLLPTWLSTNLVVDMLNSFDVDAAQLVVGDLPLLQLKVVLQVFNDATHNWLIPQPSHIDNQHHLCHSRWYTANVFHCRPWISHQVDNCVAWWFNGQGTGLATWEVVSSTDCPVQLGNQLVALDKLFTSSHQAG